MRRPKLRTSFYADFCPILNVQRCICKYIVISDYNILWIGHIVKIEWHLLWNAF